MTVPAVRRIAHQIALGRDAGTLKQGKCTHAGFTEKLGRVLINEQIKVRFWGTADADGSGAFTASVANDPTETSGSWKLSPLNGAA